jgi:lipoyl-dependent peroxiredoxin
MDIIKPIFTATATATGGRNGHTEASDGSVKVDLSVPKALGGPGNPATTTPEHLFAAGYAACFGGALDFVAKQKRKDATNAKVVCAVSIGRREVVASHSPSGCASKIRPFRRWSLRR